MPEVVPTGIQESFFGREVQYVGTGEPARWSIRHQVLSNTRQSALLGDTNVHVRDGIFLLPPINWCL